jgi:hypothetical protein
MSCPAAKKIVKNCRRLTQTASACAICVVWILMALPSVQAKNIFDDDWTPPARKAEAPGRSPSAPASVTDPAKADPGNSNPTSTAADDRKPIRAVDAPPPVVLHHAIPSKDKQSASRRLLAEVYARQMADRTPEARKKLAAELLQSARKTTQASSDQFVLFMGASVAASEGVDLRLCFEAIDGAAEVFDLDALSMKTSAVATVTGRGSTPGDEVDSCVAGLSAVEELLSRDDFTEASKALVVLRRLGGSDADAQARLTALSRQADLQRLEFPLVAPAMEKLKADPADPAANATVGRYMCLVKGDWEHGLPLLTKGNDAVLKQIAVAEIAVPAAADDQKAVGDLWWGLAAQSVGKPIAMACKKRSVFWYRKCEGALTGLAAAAIKQRLATLPVELRDAGSTGIAARKGKLIPGLRFEWFEGEQFDTKRGERLDTKICSSWGDGAPGPGAPVDHFSTRWSGFIRMPKEGTYKLQVRSDDGSRLLIDGKKVFENWDSAIEGKPFEVELGPEPKSLVFEQREQTGNSHAELFMRMPGDDSLVVVPPWSFLVDPTHWDGGATVRWMDGQGLERTIFNDEKFQKVLTTSVDANVDWALWFARITDTTPQAYVSIRWRGFLLVPKTGEYRFNGLSDDGFKLLIDGKQIAGSSEKSRPDATLNLSAGPHQFQTDFYQGNGEGYISIHWSQIGEFVEHPIPPQYFFLTRAAAAKAQSGK